MTIWNFIKSLFGCKCHCCNDCTCDEAKFDGDLNVEHITATDRQQMFLNYAKDYRWFEIGITLKNYMDEDDTSSKVESVYNVFQTVTERGKSFDTQVVCIAHKGSMAGVETKSAFWVGDMLLNEECINLTFEQAYDRLMQANVVKPHSRQCVLRKELGPKEANPQYIFGNTSQHVYVDAVTGNVSTTNPAFEGFNDDDEKVGYAFTWLKKCKSYVGGPLGEWP